MNSKEPIATHQEFLNVAPVQSNSSDKLDELIDRILSYCQMTYADQEQFMSALLAKKSLSESEQTQINRVFDGLRSGLIKIIDQSPRQPAPRQPAPRQLAPRHRQNSDRDGLPVQQSIGPS